MILDLGFERQQKKKTAKKKKKVTKVYVSFNFSIEFVVRSAIIPSMWSLILLEIMALFFGMTFGGYGVLQPSLSCCLSLERFVDW